MSDKQDLSAPRKFEQGSLVILNSGGPIMGVVGYVEGSGHRLVAEWMSCSQMGQYMQRDVFDERCLKSAGKAADPPAAR